MSTLASIPRRLARLPARLLLGLVWLYQKTLSPVLPAVFGPYCACRFHPTCSHYAAQALRTHGAFRGTLLTIVRLLKCTPLHPGGFDYVPPKTKPRARKISNNKARQATASNVARIAKSADGATAQT